MDLRWRRREHRQWWRRRRRVRKGSSMSNLSNAKGLEEAKGTGGPLEWRASAMCHSQKHPGVVHLDESRCRH